MSSDKPEPTVLSVGMYSMYHLSITCTDVLGCNHISPIDEFPDEKWDHLIAVNLSASFHTIKHILPGMKERGSVCVCVCVCVCTRTCISALSSCGSMITDTHQPCALYMHMVLRGALQNALYCLRVHSILNICTYLHT